MFESISSTKNGNNSVEVPFVILGVSIKRLCNLRFKRIVESKIVFLLKLLNKSGD